ncbi:MAG: site-2 protease family protein [Candidatus Dormibacteraeota bacterium]|nr:site-2 protease family protein [Candidatus Dormibacteraeota bacterium]MDQ6885504.1 site-2 protease family protein [Candidatus Dormibacteraeota bacterium]
MNENLSLGRIAGIHVGLNWSLLVVAALIAWSLATGILPSASPGQTSGAYWTAGVVSAFLFLVSLLAHELAHSIVAMRRGVRVEGITLWLFGGVSRFSSDTSSPGAQALITFVGPLTSLVLGALFYLVSAAFGGGAHPGLLSATLAWLGYINILLGVFNLLPAFPLDGGRLLQSLIWLRTGDRLRATSIAARIGMVFAFLLIAYGLASFLLAGNLIGGIWSVFLGWFLLSAARSEEASGLIRQALSGISVAEVMTPNPVQAPDDISVEDALHRYVLASRHSTFPTHDAVGRLSGLLTMAALKNVAPDARAATLVKEVACPLDRVSIASPADPVNNLLGLPEGCSEGRTLVVDGGRLVGIISPSDISRLVQRSLSGRAQAPAGKR